MHFPRAFARRIVVLPKTAVPSKSTCALSRLLFAFALGLSVVAYLEPVRAETLVPQPRIWSHENLVAWTIAPFDSEKRSPQSRSQMLTDVGISKYGYSWRPKDSELFDAEIEALNDKHVQLVSWALYGIENPYLSKILKTFARHKLRPQLWVMDSPSGFPKTLEDWAKRVPDTMPLSTTSDVDALTMSDREELRAAIDIYRRSNFPQSPQQQTQRVEATTVRISRLARAASRYGVGIGLYNHNGWFGEVRNQVAVIRRLREIGINNVGIVYNFSHARDQFHDDTTDFPALWAQIKNDVLAVNLSGVGFEGQNLFPSEGTKELGMMRVIEESGWKGSVGLNAEMPGDAKLKLQNILAGVDWLAAEISEPGSGGAKPFATARERGPVPTQ